MCVYTTHTQTDRQIDITHTHTQTHAHILLTHVLANVYQTHSTEIVRTKQRFHGYIQCHIILSTNLVALKISGDCLKSAPNLT